jgi:hypothetical protein
MFHPVAVEPYPPLWVEGVDTCTKTDIWMFVDDPALTFQLADPMAHIIEECLLPVLRYRELLFIQESMDRRVDV